MVEPINFSGAGSGTDLICGGAIVTQWVSVVMIISALGCAYFMKAAYASQTPESYFYPFLLLFIILFAATGVGNGSTFRSIANL